MTWVEMEEYRKWESSLKKIKAPHRRWVPIALAIVAVSLTITGLIGWSRIQVPIEFRAGLVLPPEERIESLSPSYELRGPSPDRFDWRTENGKDWTTPIEDQNPFPTCWAYASLAAIEAAINIELGDPDYDLDLAERYVMDRSPGGRNGWCIFSTLDWIKEHGVIQEKDYPSLGWEEKVGYYLLEWGRVSLNRESIKNALIAFGPLIAGMRVYPDFKQYRGGVYRQERLEEGYELHAVVIVGYDEIEDYWICKNSWGTWWGEGGWFRIGFDQCRVDSTTVLWVKVSPPEGKPLPEVMVRLENLISEPMKIEIKREFPAAKPKLEKILIPLDHRIKRITWRIAETEDVNLDIQIDNLTPTEVRMVREIVVPENVSIWRKGYVPLIVDNTVAWIPEENAVIKSCVK